MLCTVSAIIKIILSSDNKTWGGRARAHFLVCFCRISKNALGHIIQCVRENTLLNALTFHLFITFSIVCTLKVVR